MADWTLFYLAKGHEIRDFAKGLKIHSEIAPHDLLVGGSSFQFSRTRRSARSCDILIQHVSFMGVSAHRTGSDEFDKIMRLGCDCVLVARQGVWGDR